MSLPHRQVVRSEERFMSELVLPRPRGWFGLVSSSATAVIVGFASTILLIMEAARAVGATQAQQASWAASLCFAMAITSLVLSWRYRLPIITAWSTPGAALIATSATGVSYESALGAFVAAGLLTCLAALVTPLARMIERIPAALASAMLAGVLLRYSMGVPGAATVLPWLVLPLIVIFFALRLSYPLFAVPAVVVLGAAAAAFAGLFPASCCTLRIAWLEWTTPRFDLATVVTLGIPLFLVTMASQNLPGFAVLRAAGYQPPVKGALWVTGIGSILAAPFGSHQINLAAITASLVTGPDCHPDPARRWLVAWPYFFIYAAVGLAASSLVETLGALPSPLIVAIAGLALLSPLVTSLSAALKEQRDIETALVTFLVTASGLTLGGIGSAFWGLLAGLVLYGARHLRIRSS
jgi:benzoate membrane transport protein